MRNSLARRRQDEAIYQVVPACFPARGYAVLGRKNTPSRHEIGETKGLGAVSELGLLCLKVGGGGRGGLMWNERSCPKKGQRPFITPLGEPQEPPLKKVDSGVI